MRYIKKILLLCCIFLSLFCGQGCNNNVINVGTGKKGIVADIDWHKYDELIKKIKALPASAERDELLYKAEEMLLDEYCVIPIYNTVYKCMKKKGINGIYITPMSDIMIYNINFDDGRKVANVYLSNEPDVLDPGTCSYSNETAYIENCMATLVKMNENGEYVNQLLDSYSISDDGLKWTFHIKKGLKWSDGKELTAKDFVYALKRNANTKTGAPLNYMLSSIAGFPNNLQVYAIDETTMEVNLNARCSYLLSIFSKSITVPLREDIVEKDKNWYRNLPLVTPGPFKITKWVNKASMVLEKNEYYYDADNIKVDKINCMIGGNVTSIYNAYIAGDIDVIMLAVPQNEKSDEITIDRVLGVEYIVFNTKSKMFEGMTKDEAKKLRQAISYCIDRKFMQEISNDNIYATNHYIADLYHKSDGKYFYNDGSIYDKKSKNAENMNLDKARELLKEIGYHFNKDGKIIEDLTFELLANSTDYDYMSVLQRDLDKIGINMKIRKRVPSFISIGDYIAALQGWYADYYDPLTYLELFTTDSENNFAFIGRELP